MGRERELELLVDALDAPPALVLVEGEAGIGKSRLVHEAMSHPAFGTRRAFVGNCHRLGDPFLLGPVVEALRGAAKRPPSRPLSPVVGALRPLLPELADLLPVQPAPVGDGRAERHRIFRGLRELMDALGPAVFALEDLGTRAGGRRVATRVGRMGATCRYSARYVFAVRRLPFAVRRLPARLRPRDRRLVLRIVVRYQGNSLLRGDLSPPTRVRVRR